MEKRPRLRVRNAAVRNRGSSPATVEASLAICWRRLHRCNAAPPCWKFPPAAFFAQVIWSDMEEVWDAASSPANSAVSASAFGSTYSGGTVEITNDAQLPC